MSGHDLHGWRRDYARMLFDDIVPFWTRFGADREFGGVITYLDRDGSVLSDDKAVWIQGRATWLFAHLYNRVEPKQQWLELSELMRGFLEAHCFDSDRRMFFSVTRDGRPLRKRRYLFSEVFATIGLAENAVARRDKDGFQRAASVFQRLVDLYRHPDHTAQPKIIPTTRVIRGHSMPMILLVTARTVRNAATRFQADPAIPQLCESVIDDAAHQVQNIFYKPDLHCIVERVLPDGSMLETPEGRVVCPGHAMETCWFLLDEARDRKDGALRDFAAKALRESLEIGWDREYGGIFYHMDARGRPTDSLEHDMKLWWPHAEALCATLVAYRDTGDPVFLEWHQKVRDYTLSHFPDPEFGEWYGYLHRDGTVSTPVKGNMWKGPFHIPRALLKCVETIDEIQAAPGGGVSQ